MSRESTPAAVPAKEAGESLYEGTLDFVTDALRPFVRLLKWLGAIEAFQRINFIQFLTYVPRSRVREST